MLHILCKVVLAVRRTVFAEPCQAYPEILDYQIYRFHPGYLEDQLRQADPVNNNLKQK